MNNKVFVTSRSFSENDFLRKKLLSKYPRSKFNETGKRLKTSELISLAQYSDKLIIALDKIDIKTLSYLPNLKVISKYGVGLDNINLKDLEKLKIRLGWKRGQNSRAVSELVMGYILAISRDLFNYQNSMKKLSLFKQFPSNELTHKKIGIVGCGSIRSDLIKLLSPYKCQIFVNDIRKINLRGNLQKQCSLNTLLEKSDIISIHTPLTSKTFNLINKDNFQLCKKNLLIINCARGGIINESDLNNFLKKNKNSAAALDVFEKEPALKHKLFKNKNFYCSPHVGGSTYQSIINMGLSAIEGLDEHINIKKLYKYGYE